MGNIIVIIVLAVVVGLAVRSILKSRGCHCDGNCSNCKNCH